MMLASDINTHRVLLKLQSERLYYANTMLDNPHHVEIPVGVTAVIGPNGAGKSLLGEIITRGRNFRTNSIAVPEGFKAKKVEFADIHSLRGITASGYYQQRYEATMNDEVPTVADVLPDGERRTSIVETCSRLGLKNVLNKRVNYLSSGELRKLLISVALSERPDLLILDNPYIGLDRCSRDILNQAILQLATNGISIMLLVCDPFDIPDYVDAVLPVVDKRIELPVAPVINIDDIRRSLLRLFDVEFDLDAIPAPPIRLTGNYNDLIRFNDCLIANGLRHLISHFNWNIKEGERWSLSGPNGSGKSTLLSLVNADNPAGYRSDITLFDRRRGSGESIWDIKRLIGYVSPEMRLYFTGTGSLTDVIGHGLVDTVGNYVKLTATQTTHAHDWIKVIGLEAYANSQYGALSAGQRQLALVARALIKQPRLLILDEPMHGLDYGRKAAMRYLIEYMCRRADSREDVNPMSMIYVTHCPEELPGVITHTLSL